MIEYCLLVLLFGDLVTVKIVGTNGLRAGIAIHVNQSLIVAILIIVGGLLTLGA
ncbi:MAG TPA: hypothetical protein VE593_06140 [Nitrososphaeraceae archaeon]|nr:hypothetical protein [Nitrososphaeraceae archaeon]